jgi:uncharacterized repeat protein (TIGR03803 family)
LKLAKKNLSRSSAGFKFTSSAAIEGNATAPGQTSCWRLIGAVAFICAVMTMSAHAQTLTTLTSFNGMDGFEPESPLAQGPDGSFFGTAPVGGNSNSRCVPDGCGTIFKITPDGAVTTVYRFCSLANCDDGIGPVGGLVLASDGNFYGTTANGGGDYGAGCGGCGTVFRMTPDGILTRVKLFHGPDGADPNSTLVQSFLDGNLYGTTRGGGIYGRGTIFKVVLGGSAVFKVSDFCALPNCTDGSDPIGLVQGLDGYLYGVTGLGGVAIHPNIYCAKTGCGTIYRATATGKRTILYNFCHLANCVDGMAPSQLISVGSAFYGVTGNGGASTQAYCTSAGGCGTIFLFNAAGELTSLYSFCTQLGCPDGIVPNGLTAVRTGTSGAVTFYGTTLAGGNGVHGSGTIFKMTTFGTRASLTVLHDFCSLNKCADGASTYSSVLQGTNGVFYGATELGGASGGGTVYSLDIGLPSFVEPVPSSSEVGANVIILGNNLTATTSVSFAGTPATFTVVSDSEITASVPTGAATGELQVTTPTGALSSNVPFHVTPQITGFSPASGAAGASVVITGESLKGTTAVTFGGVTSGFTVNSDTQITAVVPTGAATGRIAAQTPGGHVQSATNFTVTP